MAIKPYDELTIQDNFLFQKIMRNKRICKLTLERLLDIDIKDISYLSTKGQVDDISKPLKNFLDYVDGHAPADELMQEIDSEVNIAKNREEWRREYMTLALEIEKEKKISLEQGEIEGRVKSIKSLMKNMKLSAEAAMEAIGIPKEDFSKYITML